MDQFSEVMGQRRGAEHSGEPAGTATLNLTPTETVTMSAPELRLALIALGIRKQWDVLGVLVNAVAAQFPDCPQELAACHAALRDDPRQFLLILQPAQLTDLAKVLRPLLDGGRFVLPGGVPAPTDRELALLPELVSKLRGAGARA